MFALTITLLFVQICLLITFEHLGCHSLPLLKRISSRDWMNEAGTEIKGTWGRAKKTQEMSIEIVFRLPGGFFFSVTTPLNSIHSHHLLTSGSFFWSNTLRGYSTYERSSSTEISLCSMISVGTRTHFLSWDIWKTSWTAASCEGSHSR